MVAIVADYRVSGRHRTSAFEAMADAKSALRWVRAHSAELGIESNRIVAAGGSAGGHIALSAAVFDAYDEPDEDKTISSKPNALVLFNPAVDTTHSTGSAPDRFGVRGRMPLFTIWPLACRPRSSSMGRPTRNCRTRGRGIGIVGARMGGSASPRRSTTAPRTAFHSDTAEGQWYRRPAGGRLGFLIETGYLRAKAMK